MNLPENEPNGQARFAAFLEGMQQLGWADGRSAACSSQTPFWVVV
jgi:hypothetical protein